MATAIPELPFEASSLVQEEIHTINILSDRLVANSNPLSAASILRKKCFHFLHHVFSHVTPHQGGADPIGRFRAVQQAMRLDRDVEIVLRRPHRVKAIGYTRQQTHILVSFPQESITCSFGPAIKMLVSVQMVLQLYRFAEHQKDFSIKYAALVHVDLKNLDQWLPQCSTAGGRSR